jgi:hypothetical protein
MPHDKNISPVGWYVGTYLIRFIELGVKDNENPETRFLSWENTVIVKAENLSEAYSKVVAIAKATTKPYKGGKAGIPVKWIFEGITELLPIYEALEDGAEIMWKEHKPRKLRSLKKLVRGQRGFKQVPNLSFKADASGAA